MGTANVIAGILCYIFYVLQPDGTGKSNQPNRIEWIVVLIIIVIIQIVMYVRFWNIRKGLLSLIARAEMISELDEVELIRNRRKKKSK